MIHFENFSTFSISLIKPTETLTCGDNENKNLYFFSKRKCDDFVDCLNGADESYDMCGGQTGNFFYFETSRLFHLGTFKANRRFIQKPNWTTWSKSHWSASITNKSTTMPTTLNTLILIRLIWQMVRTIWLWLQHQGHTKRSGYSSFLIEIIIEKLLWGNWSYKLVFDTTWLVFKKINNTVEFH